MNPINRAFRLKLKWKGIIAVWYVQPTSLILKTGYSVWKKYSIKKLMIAYTAARVAQTVACIEFPQVTPNYTFWDTLMIPVLLEGISKGLIQTNNTIGMLLGLSMETSAHLAYKGFYKSISYLLIYLGIAEIFLFGAIVIVRPDPLKYNPWDIIKTAHQMQTILLDIIWEGTFPNLFKRYLEISRAQKYLQTAFFVQGTPNERVIAIAKIVMLDQSSSGLAALLGPAYSTGIAVVTVLNTLTF